MTAVKASDVDGALRRLDPRVPVLLIYGPDAGLVNERARSVAEGAVTDAADPFQLVRIDGEAVASDATRLAEEATTIGLFGSKRVLWVRPTTRNIAAGLEALLAAPLRDVLVVIEAGDLAKTSPLRVLCERSLKALALPCYADAGRDLGALLDETLRAAGLTITREAREALLASVGGDRSATRGELAKLILYAHGRREVTVDDVDAVLSDTSALAQDSAIDAAFAGSVAAADLVLRRLFADGVAPSAVLGAALRHALALLAARLDCDAGKSPATVVEAWRGLHFRRKASVRRQLAAWSTSKLRHAIQNLQGEMLDSRRQADEGVAIASCALLGIAQHAAAQAEYSERG